MIPFMDSTREMDNNWLDSQLWHACAGGMVQMPPINAAVFYFPQGHAEHACQNPTIDFGNYPKIPPFVLCRVCSVKFMADPDTDEVYSKIGLIPMMNPKEHDFEDAGMNSGLNGNEGIEKPASFAKTLTQSDANNGGGFSVPRYCAEMIFPRLDYNADPPVQTILAKDVHGETWKFRHIYRGTPRRHLLTTGWSNFVNHKKLVAGDSIVFLRPENGDLRVGIRRAKRGVFGESPAGWNCAIPYNGFSSYLRDNENHLMKNENAFNGNLGKVRCESVLEAATLASNGRPFEVVYYPRASTPEFCVKASLVKTALQIRWCSGMRFKMAFETEDSSRISWFMGTISSVQVADPIRWPDSPWRLLQVTWDEPDLLQNVKRVSPWLVESVSNMPSMHLSPFSPPNKKFKLSDHPEFPIDGHLRIPPWFNCQPNNTPAGMQGARHAHSNSIGTISLSEFHLNKFQSGLFTKSPSCPLIHQPSSSSSENVSCKLTMGNSSQTPQKNEDVKTPQLVLFGQPILTEQQISQTGNSSSDGNSENRSETGAIKHVGDQSFSDFAKTTKTLTIQKDSSGDKLGL